MRILTAFLLALIPVLASQPQPAALRLETFVSTVSNSTLRVTNAMRTSATVSVQMGELSGVRVPAGRTVVGAGSQAVIDLGLLRLAEGVQTMHLRTSVILADGQSRPGPSLYETLRVTSGRVEKVAFEQGLPALDTVRVSADLIEAGTADLGAGYVDRSPMPVSSFVVGVPVAGATRTQLSYPDVERLTALGVGVLPAAGDISFGSTTTMMAAAEQLDASGQSGVTSIIGPGGGGTTSEPWPTISVSGKWFVSVPYITYEGDQDWVLVPGYAWTAKIWALQPNGTWKMAGNGAVKADGSWSAKVAVDPSSKVRVVMEMGNRFVRISNASGTTYSFAFDWFLSQGLDTGEHKASLDKSMRGAHEMYTSANQLWTKLVTNGISPLRNEPIQVTYPNTLATNACVEKDSNGNKYPWSCADPATGKVWIIAEHALAPVTIHEIGHSVNAFYWNGLPADAGGWHTMEGCYTKGVAMTEGFATFLAYWAMRERDSQTPALEYFNYNIENKQSACVGNTNETSVSMAFWDMYDTISDTVDSTKRDSWYYINPGAPISLYLKTKMMPSMADFAPVVKQGMPTSLYGEVDKLFRLNSIIQ